MSWLIGLQVVHARGCAYIVMVHRSDAVRALHSLRDLRLNGNTCKVSVCLSVCQTSSKLDSEVCFFITACLGTRAGCEGGSVQKLLGTGAGCVFCSLGTHSQSERPE